MITQEMKDLAESLADKVIRDSLTEAELQFMVRYKLVQLMREDVDEAKAALVMFRETGPEPHSCLTGNIRRKVLAVGMIRTSFLGAMEDLVREIKTQGAAEK